MPKYILNMTKKLVAHSIDIFKDTFMVIGVWYLTDTRDEFFLIWVSCGFYGKLFVKLMMPQIFLKDIWIPDCHHGCWILAWNF